MIHIKSSNGQMELDENDMQLNEFANLEFLQI